MRPRHVGGDTSREAKGMSAEIGKPCCAIVSYEDPVALMSSSSV
eukprot:CAMPEP_0195592512 /NCGR_PEP_ID=MMETSP0815-20121206/391_1 /TAXON_ID=97485 /ORGANISM="Prymnesium parvum, Strain Texoma1" /LENGTH=43 /DNA_ID= /DNA_START= /DNA_END= /DNA_ORIENTATION=